MSQKKERQRRLPLVIDVIWNLPDYVERFAQNHPKLKWLAYTGLVLAILLGIGLILLFSAIGNIDMGSILSDTGNSVIGGWSDISVWSGWLYVFLFAAALISGIALLARRYNRKNEDDK